MQILTQFIESLKTLELNVFLINTHLEPLMINQYVPKSVQSLVEDSNVVDLIESMTLQLTYLNDLLSNVATYSKEATKTNKYVRNEPYANFIIDEAPVVKEGYYKQLSFEDIMDASAKAIKPIKRIKPLDYTGTCIHCGAPNEYIYTHTSTQKRCKVCLGTFTIHPNYHDEITHHCPHCDRLLDLKHIRAEYDVLVCPSSDCPFYLKNKSLVKNNQAEHLKMGCMTYFATILYMLKLSLLNV